MAHGRLRRLVPQVVTNGPAGHGGQGRCGDELVRRGRHDDLHVGTTVPEAPHEFRGLVGGNAAADAEQNIHGLVSARPKAPHRRGREFSPEFGRVCQIVWL